MWHHPATVKARLRRWSGLVFRPVAVAFDPRLEGLEHRLVERMGAMERRVATDAEVTAEMTITQSRLLARLEARLASLESRLAGEPAAAEPGWSSRPVAVGWALGILNGLGGPARIGLSSPGDAGLPVSLAALGHEVVLLDSSSNAGVPAHPRIHVASAGDAARDLDAALVLCPDSAAGPAPVDAALAARAAARLRPGGTLLLATPQSTAGGLDELLGGLQLESTTLAAPGPAGLWEVAPDGVPAGDGLALLRATATR